MSLYQPLKPNEARILVLDPAPDRTSPITCNLRVVSLGKYFATDALGDSGTSFAPLPFEALSYVWGPQATNAEITVNGHVKRVGINLERALRGLRRKGKVKDGSHNSSGLKKLKSILPHKASDSHEILSNNKAEDEWTVGQDFGIPNFDDAGDGRRFLWIDAVCIDQQNMKEKTIQVRLMSRIYRNAARVLVWMGESDADIDRAVLWMKQTLECGLVDSSHLDELQDLGLEESKADQKKKSKSMEMKTLASAGLKKLIANEYWIRMWCAQEFGLAHSDPLLICGKSSFEAGYLWPALEATGRLQDMSSLLSDNRHVQNTYSSKFSSMQTSLLIRHALKRRGDIPYQIKPSLGLFILLTWARKCEDPRDKIFALYGLFSPRRKNLPAPDYDKGHALVIAEAVSYIINEENDFDFFCYMALSKPVVAEIKSSSMQVEQQPSSWLPDLFDGSLESARCPARYMTRHVSANGGLRLNDRVIKPFVSNDLKFLVVHGAFIDRVQRIIPVTSSKTGNWSDKVKEFLALIDERQHQVRHELPNDNLTLAALIIRGNLQDKYQTLTPAFEPEEDESALSDEKQTALIQMFAELTAQSSHEDAKSDLQLSHSRLERYVDRYIQGRHLFVTMNGIHGLASPDMREGDELYSLSGIKLPFILRRVNRGAGAKFFRGIGGANVSGIMMGELNQIDDLKSWVEELCIV
jgi:Heterokaryon incompatibility protein (HET)